MEDKELWPIFGGMMGLIAIVGVYTYLRLQGTPSVTPEVPPEGEIVPPGSEAIIYGFVTDALTGLAIKDVQVVLDSLVRYTAWEGQYEVRDLVVGRTYIMTFSMAGYKTITLKVTPIADLNEVSVAMEYE